MKYLVFVGMIIPLIGTGVYIKDMLKGKAKPNKVTWLMWGIAPLIAAFAALTAGARIRCNTYFYDRIWIVINFYNIIVCKKFILEN